MIRIERLPHPGDTDAAPHPWLVGLTAVDHTVSREQYGNDDFSDDVAARQGRLRGSAYAHQDAWVALEGDRVVAYAWCHRPLREDRDVGNIELAVLPEARRRGLGDALMTTLTEFLSADGRGTLMGFTFSPAGAEGPDALAARSGTGAVDPRLPGNAFAVHHGFTLEQVERPSTLTLSAETLQRADALGRAAASVAGPDYELVGWAGPCPDDLLDGLADLVARMSTDVPMASELNDAQVWDADRLRSAEARNVEIGKAWVTVAARHVPSGTLAAYTEIEWPLTHPVGAWQSDTLVRADHRGHRLGMLVKAANLRRLVDANPAAERVHTWNAAENTHMLAINDALGFRPTGLEGTWRRRG